MKEKLLVSLDGSAESLVTAWLLKKQGYTLRGVMFDVTVGTENQAKYVEKAAEIEKRLGIPVQIVHCGTEARQVVFAEVEFGIARGYRYDIKSIFHQKYLLPKLLQLKEQHGFDKIATGHRVIVHHEPESGNVKVFRYHTPKQDEAHLLIGLTQTELRCFEFPLGSIPLSMIHKLAGELDLLHTDLKPAKFELHYEKPDAAIGNVYATDGSYVGTADDPSKMSLGEMLKRNHETSKEQYVVFEVDPNSNAVLVGNLDERMISEIWLENASWFSGHDLQFQMKECQMKWAHGTKFVPVTVMQYAAGGMKALLDETLVGADANLFSGDTVMWVEGEEVLGGARVIKCI